MAGNLAQLRLNEKPVLPASPQFGFSWLLNKREAAHDAHALIDSEMCADASAHETIVAVCPGALWESRALGRSN